MSKRNLKAALEKGGGARSYVDPVIHEKLSDEELRRAAFDSRRNRENASSSDKLADDNTRNSLLRKAGFDWFDILEIHPNPNNAYTITDEDIENLAGLIEHSHETQPLVLRETKDGIEIVDGERRWSAHKLLYERTGNDFWRMVPGRCHALGSLSDEQAEFIMHSNNLGQRELSPSEKAMGFAAVADALVEWRKNDPSLKGKKTREVLAERFGVSQSTVANELAIARGLSTEGKELLDEGRLMKNQAVALSRMSSELQEAITEAINAQDLAGEEIDEIIEPARKGEASPKQIAESARAKTQRPKTTDRYLRSARNALKRANKCEDPADYILLGEIKQLLRSISAKQDVEKD